MTSTTLQVKKHSIFNLFKWTLRRNVPITLLYGILLLLVFPVVTLWQISTTSPYTDIAGTLEELAQFYYPATSAVVSFFAVLSAVFMFRFLHDRRSVDMFMSLPLTRTQIFISRFLAGLVILVAPLLLTGAISMAIVAVGGTTAVYYVFSNMLLSLLGGVALYSMSCFIVLCCGKTIDALVIIAAINAAVPVALFISEQIFVSWVPGFGNISLIPLLLYFVFTPVSVDFLSLVTDAYTKAEFIGFIIWWVVFTTIMVVASIKLMSRRKTECAQIGFAFKLPAYFIRFIVSYTAGLLLGMIMSQAVWGVPNYAMCVLWFWIGFAIGSFVSHMILQLIFARGFKGFGKSMGYYGAVVGATVVLYVLTITGFMGVDTYIPDVEDVEGIYVDVSYDNHYGFNEGYFVDDPVIIGMALEAHSAIVESMHDVKYPYVCDYIGDGFVPTEDPYQPGHFHVNYKLENGRVVSRRYDSRLVLNKKVSEILIELRLSKNYVQAFHHLFKADYDNVAEFEIMAIKNGNTGMAYNYDFRGQTAIQEKFLNTLKEEYLSKWDEKSFKHLFCIGTEELKDGYQLHVTLSKEDNYYWSSFTINIPSDYTETISYIDSLIPLPKYTTHRNDGYVEYYD